MNKNMRGRRCIFIGGKQIGVDCLRVLLAKGVRPLLVIGNTDDNGKDKIWHGSLIKAAKKAGLQTLRGVRVTDSAVIKKISALDPEMIFCVGPTQIIPPEVLRIPRDGSINIHPALLPKYRGRYSIPHAIFNGEKYTGVTMHWMDKGIDSGPIIAQRKVRIKEDDTAKTLYDKFTSIGKELFVDFLNKWLRGERIRSVKQNEKKSTYLPKGLPNGGEIDWSWDGAKIRRFIRAMTFEPFPPASFMIGSKKMVIIDEKYEK